MKSAKAFLLAYFGVYLAVSLGINFVLGPPAMSETYLAQYKAEHDRYMSISKRADYKLYLEQPERHPPTETNAADFAFADEYQTREAYRAEETRRGRYNAAFDVFRAGMIVLLVCWFGAKPIGAFLDSRVALVRERLDKSAELTRDAESRIAAARARIAGVEAERARLIQEAEASASAEAHRIEETTAAALAHLEQEQRDRVQNEKLLARRALKRELVEGAIALAVGRYETERTPATEAALLDKFVEQMERVR